MSDPELDIFVGLNRGDDFEVLGQKKELNDFGCLKDSCDTLPGNDEIIKIEEVNLEKLIFGDKNTFIKRLTDQTGTKRTSNDDKDNDGEKGNKKRKPAWYDSDDEDDLKVGDVVAETKYTGPLNHLNKDKTYKSYLTRKFERIVPTPKWADLNRKEEIDSDEEILKVVGHLAALDRTNLKADILKCKSLKHLNRTADNKGPVTSIHFHPTSSVGIVCQADGSAAAYAIDGFQNEKLHGMKFKNFHIACSKLLKNGKDLIFGSEKHFYYCYDLIQTKAIRMVLPKVMTNLKLFEVSPDNNFIAAAGRFGEIYLLDMKTKEFLHTFKQSDKCVAIKFSNDSKKILAHSSESDVTIFDIRQEKVEHIFTDDGCINGTCLSISPNSSLLATGSNEGVVNLYNYSDVFNSTNPTPQKILYNLKTSISDLKFNHNGEILGICSKKIDSAIKMVHFPTATVFKNFPNHGEKLGQIRCVEFSPQSGFFALGTQKSVPLFRLKHFGNY